VSLPGSSTFSFRGRAHDELQGALLRYLSGQPHRAAWGEIVIEDARPDAYAVSTRGNKFSEPHIYEVKAERADFVGEIRSGKWRKYLPISCRFDFVTPPDLCLRSEIPEEAGWIVHEDGMFKRRKRAPQRQVTVPDGFLMKVALYRMPSMPVGRAWVADQWISHIQAKRSLGYAVAEILRDKIKAKADLKRLQAEIADAQARLLRLEAAEIHPPYATADLFEAPKMDDAA